MVAEPYIGDMPEIVLSLITVQIFVAEPFNLELL